MTGVAQGVKVSPLDWAGSRQGGAAPACVCCTSRYVLRMRPACSPLTCTAPLVPSTICFRERPLAVGALLPARQRAPQVGAQSGKCSSYGTLAPPSPAGPT